eukprot:CAMPEP_0174724126 /NCGR_PEP_ID=MMETSP1094-20130205/42644_1 /TAXON_ID=156173 /ORGANISM="Chrysochromulina brevifilum, Strain UTEX LB 985" /LENGTH=88 /DNA_ID=CAMNT_0015925295 /DNA_START=282 /DNA_END=545 /DNA_ORIENTATION=+
MLCRSATSPLLRPLPFAPPVSAWPPSQPLSQPPSQPLSQLIAFTTRSHAGPSAHRHWVASVAAAAATIAAATAAAIASSLAATARRAI